MKLDWKQDFRHMFLFRDSNNVVIELFESLQIRHPNFLTTLISSNFRTPTPFYFLDTIFRIISYIEISGHLRTQRVSGLVSKFSKVLFG